MSRILVTGAAGFVALNVARALAGRGHHVVGFDHRAADDAARTYAGAGVGWMIGDVRDVQALGRAIKTHAVDVIVHAAAVTATTPESERERAADVFGVNVLGTVAALEAGHAAGVRRIIVLSSASAVGTRDPSETLIPEAAPATPGDLYGISKRTLEMVVTRLAELYSLHVVVVRLSQPYGPMERPSPDRAALSPIAEWVAAAQAGRFLTTPSLDIAKDWTYIDDVSEAFARLVEAPELRHAMYNLGLGENIPVRQVIDHIRRAWPRLEVNVMPSWTPNPNLSAARLRPPLQMTRLAADVGFQPQFTIERGIAQYAAWVKERSAELPVSALAGEASPRAGSGRRPPGEAPSAR